MHKEGVEDKAKEIYEVLNKNFRTELDLRDNYSTGYKFNDWELRGVPVRIELGPRDIENGVCVVVRRDTLEKTTVKLDELQEKVEELLDDIQKNMYNECVKRVEERTTVAKNMDEFEKNINENQGYVKAMWCGKEECENKIKEITGAHSRCIPFEQEKISDHCICCGEKAEKMVVWGRQY